MVCANECGNGMTKITGRVWLFGDDVDTDAIIPARYLNTSDPSELAKHCMEDADPLFPSKVRPGDIVVAGKNFGCGSSREHAPIALKAAGVACVIAVNFARIFYRNAFNMGLPILECADAVRDAREGDTLTVCLETGEIRNDRQGKTYRSEPVPPFMIELLQSGGLMAYVKKHHLTEL
ncbi:3-isopropylmalate/(R)-2-methylmalate dehydratase small subunit [Desulfosoma caldarium]|uniref:3-isopropylmalate dehydratase small subunit n=2 Tax=Desulfosoma caldarium TaxID=610254 RepID=A0A3N1UUE3_9BACT|nr:3-isopropylmalate dehydratase small subunit [Desulfosoma caldarium]ROQ92340.1 3-isopropylmalate/(R)-2-methylmalate dehydratase small subunit [Desulfosoma caldarium]